MDNRNEELQKYLPDIEGFLTSVLLEETKIGIASSEGITNDIVMKDMQESDIFLYARDEKYNTDVIAVLDQEWFGLLSSIMLGIEEKTRNETTIELLEEFSADLSGTVLESLENNGFEPDLSEIRVLTLTEVGELLAHREYFRATLEIEGIADDKVRAELLLGNPEAPLETEEAAGEEETGTDDDTEETKNGTDPNLDSDAEEEDDFSPLNAGEMGGKGRNEQVISGRHIEFAEFEESLTGNGNGGPHSMDLLKDVELDVSVELGRIELPLGKVLQLAKGSVIELEKLAGEPVDILVNGHHIAHGEVVVIDEHFGVRISNLVTTRKRLAGLQNGS